MPLKYLSLITVCACLAFAFCSKKKPAFNQCAQRFYYYFNEKILLNETREKMTVVFSDTHSFAEMKEILSQYKFIRPLKPEQVMNNVAMPELDRILSCGKIREEISKLKKEPNIVFACLFLREKDRDGLIGITGTFIVGLRDTADYSTLEKVSEAYHAIIQPQKYKGKTYILTATKSSPGDGMETANKFFQTGKFEFAEPDMIYLAKR